MQIPGAVPRGMNAAIAVHKNYVYVGSRTDGKNANANHAGIMIVDVANPAAPKVVNEMDPPFEGNPQESSRELRVWRSQEILIVLHTNCGGQTAHLCAQPNRSSMRFYDISGANAANPVLLHQNNRDTHEFFVWEDPKNPRRALMFASSAGGNFQIYDMSTLLNADPATRLPTQLFNGVPRLPVRAGHRRARRARASTPSRCPTTASGSTTRCSRAASASRTCRTSPTRTPRRTPTG